MSGDWRDGFLFVGNELALDFLNTRPVLEGVPQELLPNTNALLKWLIASGLVDETQAQRLHRQWSVLRDHQGVAKLQEFRERLRKAVLQLEAGKKPSTVFIDELNSLLREYPRLEQVCAAGAGFEQRDYFRPRWPEDTFAPLAHATVHVLTTADFARLRKCQNCVLHFYDTSKKGSRVWCSMNLCGNRAKVAAYADRKRLGS